MLLILTKDKKRKLVQGHGLSKPPNLDFHYFSNIANFVKIILEISYSSSSKLLLGLNIKQSLDFD